MSRYKLASLGTLLLALTLLPATAHAQSTPRIVVIDGDRVTTETAIGQQVRNRLQASAQQWQDRITTLQTEFQTQQQEAQAQQLTLSADALAQLQARLEEKQVELQRAQDDARRALDRLQAEGIEEVNQVLVPALETMAAENGYDLVLDSRMTQTGGLLYFSQAIDVTDAFIERVNAMTTEGAGS